MGAPTVTTAIEQPASAQQVAELVRERMFAGDRASRAFGMQVTHMAPGTATLTMCVRADMLNGFAICHGGLITTLADSAFAFACNARNEFTVAAGLYVILTLVASIALAFFGRWAFRVKAKVF